jgi:hypothetical protein
MNKSVVVTSLWFAVALLFIAGCSTYQAAWDNRVGVFTYDQSVKELGPPDKKEKLADGQTVAEWISRYNTGGSIGMGTGFYGGPASVGVMQTTPAYRESKLRLTFTTNNVLSAWSKH